MKILQVTPRYQPQSGGVETHVKAISEQLVNRGHEVTVVTADAGEKGQCREQRNGVEVRRYRSIAPGDAIHFSPQIIAAAQTADVDIIHAHNYHSFPLFFAAIGATDQQLVMTTHYHGQSASPLRSSLLSLYRPFGRWAIKQCDQAIAVSEWECEQLIADFDENATVIPNGVNVEKFAKARPIQRERPYLLTVGRLKEYKGVQHAIRTLSVLDKFDLLVAGSGPFREHLEQIAKEIGVLNRVEFLGYVDDEYLPKLYAGAEVFLNLSSFEAYGITVGEALAAGTPCVVRETGALTEWKQYEGCIGTRDIETETIADAINTVVGNTVAATLPTWHEVTEQIINHYKQ